MATSTNERVMAGPAPGRPMVEPACTPCSMRSSTGAWRMERMFSVLPAAAVPVRIKIPEPITAPTPNAVRLQGPRLLRSRLSGSSDARISASMLRVRKSLDTSRESALPLSLHHLLHFFLHRAARHSLRALRLRGRLLARRALQLFTLLRISNVLRIHSCRSSPFEARVFLHQFLQPVIPELHHQFRVVAIAFPANNLPDAVSGVSY